MSRRTRLHGLDVLLPFEQFEDVSIYRFLHEEQKSAAPVLLAKQPQQLHANLVVTREENETGASVARYLESVARERTVRNASFKVLGSGEAQYLEQPVAWLDTTERAGDQVPVFQRYLAAKAEGRRITLLTITGSEAQIRAMSKAIGLEV